MARKLIGPASSDCRRASFSDLVVHAIAFKFEVEASLEEAQVSLRIQVCLGGDFVGTLRHCDCCLTKRLRDKLPHFQAGSECATPAGYPFWAP